MAVKSLASGYFWSRSDLDDSAVRGVLMVRVNASLNISQFNAVSAQSLLTDKRSDTACLRRPDSYIEEGISWSSWLFDSRVDY